MSETVVAVRSIEIVTAEIHTIRDNVARVFMDGVVQIGRRLEEAKQLVPQGEWLTYLDRELGYKPSTAQNYMRIAREFGSGQVGLSGKTPQDFFGQLGYSQLIPLLGLPEDEREAIAEENDLASMSSREIQALIKERDEAKKAAADAKTLAEKHGQEAKDAKNALNDAKNALEDAKGKLKTEQQKAAEQADAARANAQTAAELTRQLDELKSRENAPRDLTPEELDRLRGEIAAEQAEAVKAAEARAAEMEEKLQKVKNPAVHRVNFLFGELRDTFQRLRTSLAELEDSDKDAAAKLRAAIQNQMEGWTL